MVTEFLYEVTELNKEYPITHESTTTCFKVFEKQQQDNGLTRRQQNRAHLTF
jgi:hypothetical protein